MAQDRVEQRPHVLAVGLHVGLGKAAQTTSEQIREIALVVISAQFDEQIQHLVDGGFGINPGPIDLVDKHDRTQSLLEGFLQDETGLWHRTLVGIDDQQTAIDHAEHPLHLPAEISVTRGINNVDARLVVRDSGVLRQDCDAALALQIVGVHHAGGNRFVVAEDARLSQQ